MNGRHNINAQLWPVRFKPLADELLSSWLVRLAHGHGLKVQTFCNLLFGNHLQVWNRDIDRLAPDWLLEALIEHTGTQPNIALQTTLRVFEGHVYRRYKPAGALQWMQSMMMYHRTRDGFGQQYCPACLSDDAVPYFRKSWRLSLKTMCISHECMLVDRCPNCEGPVSFHRIDMGSITMDPGPSMRQCHACRHDLAMAPSVAPPTFECTEAYLWLLTLVDDLDRLSLGEAHHVDIALLDVLRQMVKLMMSRVAKNNMNEYLSDQIGARPLDIPRDKRVGIEALPTNHRHQLLMQGAWLMLDPPSHIRQAWKDKAVRYNHLLKDFRSLPAWYHSEVISKLERRPYTHRQRRN